MDLPSKRPAREAPPWALCALTAFALMAGAAGSARAGGGIVLEVESGAAEQVPAPLLDELADQGYVAGDDLARRLLAVHSRPAGELAPEARKRARRRIKSGYEAYLRGDFESARERAARGLDELLSEPAMVARAQELRGDVYLAYATLGLANKRLERLERSRWAMESLVRSFPQRELSYSRFGPEARKLYLAARERLQEKGKGKLRVEVDGSDVMIFVDERYVSVGSIEEELYAGDYRVYLQRGEEPGRVREVTVRAGRTTELSLSWPLEEGLAIEDGRAAIRSEGGLRGAAPLARELARQLGLRRVILTSARSRGARRDVSAALLDVESGDLRREASVPLGQDGALGRDRARALARYVALGEASASVELAAAGESGASAGSSGLPGVLVGSGAAGVGVGLALVGIGIARDCPEGAPVEPRCSRSVGPTKIGLIALGAGAAAVAAGVFLWRGEERDAREPALSVVPAPDGLRVGVSLDF